MNVFALKIGIALAIVAGACGATWFGADAHYSRQYAALKAGYEQASRDQKAAVDRTIADNQAAAKAVNDEAKQQIGDMSRVIADLSVRSTAGGHALRVCAAPAGTVRPYLDPIGPAVTASPGRATEPARTAQDAAIAPAILGNVLEVGIDALKAELLWREYARKTGQDNQR